MSQKEKRNAVIRVLLDTQGQISDSLVAEQAEASIPTVRKYRSKLEDQGILDPAPFRCGRDGRVHIVQSALSEEETKMGDEVAEKMPVDLAGGNGEKEEEDESNYARVLPEAAGSLTDSVEADNGTLAASLQKTIMSGEFAYLRTDYLFVDDRFQREHSDQRVREFGETLLNCCFGLPPLMVSKRDGQYSVLDGHKRLKAARWIGLKALPCYILDLGTAEQEALVFAYLNNGRTSMKSNVTFEAMWFSGKDSDVQDIGEIIQNHGLDWTKRVGEKDRISSMAPLMEAQYTKEDLKAVLSFLNECWPGERRRLCGYTLRGVRRFRRELTEHTEYTLSTKTVRDRFKETEFQKLSGKQDVWFGKSTSMNMSRAMAQALVVLHNKNRRKENRIPLSACLTDEEIQESPEDVYALD